MVRFSVVRACVLLLALLPRPAAGAQQDTWPVTDVTFTGLSRYQSVALLPFAALVPGKATTLAELATAAQRLIDTGLFSEISYSYTTGPAGLAIAFKVIEAAWNAPVAYENFIWFTDDELREKLAAHVPGFTGTAVAGGHTNALIASGLERILAERELKGRVDVGVRVDLTGGDSIFTFTVRDAGVDFRVCSLRFPGASAVSEQDLLAASTQFIGADYSKSSLTGLANGSWRQLYRDRGYWGIEFAPPVVAPGDSACAGMAVTSAVVEGPSYRWAGARWTGVTGFDHAALDAALAMKTGTVAEARAIDDGLRATRNVFLASGYLNYSSTLTPELDTATGRATFLIDVTQGTRFRVGAFAIEGLSERDSATVAKTWRLAPGDTFDGTYPQVFIREARQALSDRGFVVPQMYPRVRLREDEGLADFTLLVER